jgi:hypothetical protein
MKWNNIDEGFPDNGAILWVKIPGLQDILCKFRDDSFGLGDLDFKVIKWRYAIPI